MEFVVGRGIPRLSGIVVKNYEKEGEIIARNNFNP
jgi:hypothetical protein